MHTINTLILAVVIALTAGGCTSHKSLQGASYYHVVLGGERVEATTGAKVIAQEGSHVLARAGSVVIAMPGSTVEAFEGSIVNARFGANVIKHKGAQVNSEQRPEEDNLSSRQ